MEWVHALYFVGFGMFLGSMIVNIRTINRYNKTFNLMHETNNDLIELNAKLIQEIPLMEVRLRVLTVWAIQNGLEVPEQPTVN